MVQRDYDTAAKTCQALLDLLLKDGLIVNTTTFYKSDTQLKQKLFRFESLCIYSNACSCELETEGGTVSFKDFVYQQDNKYKGFE